MRLKIAKPLVFICFFLFLASAASADWYCAGACKPTGIPRINQPYFYVYSSATTADQAFKKLVTNCKSGSGILFSTYNYANVVLGQNLNPAILRDSCYPN